VAQDDYYYEIQLTNKQLVFYFMAGASGLVLSFLAGVMVGRGVEGTAMGAVDARVADERVIAESPAPAAQATPAPGDFSYPARLESDKPEDSLEKTKAAAPAAAARSETPAPTPRPATQTTLPPVPTPRPPAAAASQPAQAGAGLPRYQPQTAAGFAIQVGAFKDRASADGVVKSLKTRGFPAYTVAPAGGGGGLFTVRVGIYRDRADAETVQTRLNDDKFKPYIIKQ
jgi:cell division septation protein DedD